LRETVSASTAVDAGDLVVTGVFLKFLASFGDRRSRILTIPRVLHLLIVHCSHLLLNICSLFLLNLLQLMAPKSVASKSIAAKAMAARATVAKALAAKTMAKAIAAKSIATTTNVSQIDSEAIIDSPLKDECTVENAMYPFKLVLSPAEERPLQTGTSSQKLTQWKSGLLHVRQSRVQASLSYLSNG
jgi:hypothetical protein